MRLDNRLSRMLHVLLHMERLSGPVTSERIAEMLGTNPGVIRRTMGSLRAAGYVAAERGHGGGWTLAKKLSEMSLLQVYQALGEPRLFALGSSNEGEGCPLELVADAALNDALNIAADAFATKLQSITLADLVARASECHQQNDSSEQECLPR